VIRKNINIINKYNKHLSTIIEMPETNVKDFIIISHCFTCSKLYKLYNGISKRLVEHGYGVVRYDAMGLGNSEGNFSATSFQTNFEDLITIYNYVSKEYKNPSYLLGHSLGSLISLKAANNLDSVKGVITIGSPSNFDNLIKILSNYENELINMDSVEIKVSGQNISIGIDYLNSLRTEDIYKTIKNFKKSIIMFHSNSDKIVDYNQGLKLFTSIDSDKSFITLKNVDHLVSKDEDASYIGEILYTWLENH